MLRLVNIFPIFSKKENWKKKWFVGNSDRPLNSALEGKTQSKDVKYYNLDVIISVGYRVKNDSKVHVPSPPVTAFDSFSYRIRLLQPLHSTSSAIAFVSFSHRSRMC